MPRLRAARTAEEAALTPANEPVTIELTDPPIDIAKPGSDPAPAPVTVTVGSTTASPAADPEPENPLLKQLEASRQAEALARQQAQQAQQQAQEAIRIAQQHASEAADAQVAQEESLYNGVLSDISAAEAEQAAARTDFATAAAAEDHAAMADAQLRMSNAAALLNQGKRDKLYLDRQREIAKTQPKLQPRQQPQPQLTVEQYIDQMHQLSPQQKSWLKQHPDALTDQTKNGALGYFHQQAVAAGHAVNSDEYFAALETGLGYRKPETNGHQPEPERKASMPVSAPVQRSAPSMTNGAPASPTRVELTPEQREHARIAGVDEVTYARNVLRLQELKRQGHYAERG